MTNNKEYMREYRKNNKAKIKEQTNEYWRARAVEWLKEQGIDIHENSIKRASFYLKNKNQIEHRKEISTAYWNEKLEKDLREIKEW